MEKEEGEEDGKDKGNPSQGGPGSAHCGAEVLEVGQPAATGVGTMLFGLWAAPTAATVINVLTSGFTHGSGQAVSLRRP